MEQFDTTTYTLQRKEDGTIVRVFSNGHEEPELTQEYYDSQIAFHEQVVANLEAQRDKLAAFELENPAPELPVEGESLETPPTEETTTPPQE